MLAIKIVAAVVTSLAGIAGSIYAWYTSEKTQPLRRWFLVLGVLAVTGGLVSISLAIVESFDARNDREDRQRILTDLGEVRAELKPFLQLAADRFPSASTEEALNLLAAEVSSLREQTETLEGRLFYRPLEAQLRADLVTRLSGLLSEWGDKEVSASVIFESGSTVRQSLAQELVAILRDAGMLVAGPVPQTIISTGVLPAVAVGFAPECESLLSTLSEILAAFIQTQFVGYRTPELAPCELVYRINGDPLFSPQGTVQFR